MGGGWGFGGGLSQKKRICGGGVEVVVGGGQRTRRVIMVGVRGFSRQVDLVSTKRGGRALGHSGRCGQHGPVQAPVLMCKGSGPAGGRRPVCMEWREGVVQVRMSQRRHLALYINDASVGACCLFYSTSSPQVY